MKDKLIEDLELLKKSKRRSMEQMAYASPYFLHIMAIFVLKNQGKLEEAPELQMNNENTGCPIRIITV
jgi:hypothetical protein